MGNCESSVKSESNEGGGGGGYERIASTPGDESKVGVSQSIVVPVVGQSDKYWDIEFLKSLCREDWSNAITMINYGANVDCSLDLLSCPALRQSEVWSNYYVFNFADFHDEQGLKYLVKFLDYPTRSSTTFLSVKLGEPKSPGSVLNYLCRRLLRSEITKFSAVQSERDKCRHWEENDGLALRLIDLVIDATSTTNLDAVDYQGYTALHHLARANHPRLIDKLIKRGANLEARSTDGVSARELIVKYWRKLNPPIDTILPPPPSVPHASVIATPIPMVVTVAATAVDR